MYHLSQPASPLLLHETTQKNTNVGGGEYCQAQTHADAQQGARRLESAKNSETSAVRAIDLR